MTPVQILDEATKAVVALLAGHLLKLLGQAAQRARAPMRQTLQRFRVTLARKAREALALLVVHHAPEEPERGVGNPVAELHWRIMVGVRDALRAPAQVETFRQLACAPNLIHNKFQHDEDFSRAVHASIRGALEMERSWQEFAKSPALLAAMERARSAAVTS